MKKYFAPLVFITAMLSVITTGCLKDKDFDNGSIQSTHKWINAASNRD